MTLEEMRERNRVLLARPREREEVREALRVQEPPVYVEETPRECPADYWR